MIKADFHVHTVLSPCGDIEMTPSFIIKRAKEVGLSVIGITDHNSTLQASEVQRIGEREGIFVLTGAEVTTSEEIHLLVFVDGENNLEKLQEYLESKILKIKNKPDYFGYQLVVDEAENVLLQVDYLLINALTESLEQVTEFVHSLGGIVIPAHINKSSNSLLSQIGFIPNNSKFDAVEVVLSEGQIYFNGAKADTSNFKIITSSDAHFREDFGYKFSLLNINEPITFEKIKSSLNE